MSYRERLALTEGATLVVELRDVSYADAAAPLIARQTIANPGQVPIRFEVGYHRDDIDDRNTYAVSARIVESDGRLAFTNDTAYEVITRGNPRSVDMLLVLVEPPPGSVAEGTDWRQWVEVPAQVVLASLIQNEPDHPLRIAYYQPSAEDCARRGEEGWEIRGTEIEAWVTLLQPPPTPWAIDCGADLLELDTIMVLGPSLARGLTYEVTVNEVHTATFTLTDGDLPPSALAESPVERAEVVTSEGTPPSYALNIVSGMPKGGSLLAVQRVRDPAARAVPHPRRGHAPRGGGPGRRVHRRLPDRRDDRATRRRLRAGQRVHGDRELRRDAHVRCRVELQAGVTHRRNARRGRPAGGLGALLMRAGGPDCP